MRKTIIILLSCTVFLLLAYAGYRAFQLWEQGHWMSLAKSYGSKNDAPNEYLCLEQVLRFNPRNVDACRMMANLASASGSRSALIWRKKVVELDPGSMDDRLALAQTALLAQDLATASSTLADIDDAAKKTPAYWVISAQLALTSNNPQEAEADFSEAIRLDPSNLGALLSLAVVQLHSSNTLDMAEARISLKRISMNETNAPFRTQAERELAIDALRFNDGSAAEVYSRALLQETNALFADKLLRLDALKLAGSDEYQSALVSCEREAADDFPSNPTELSQLGLWLMEHNLFGQTLAWLQSLPVKVQNSYPADVMIAQCEMLEQHWVALQNTISKQNWGDLEYTRLAYLSRALREQGLDESSKAQWDVALRAANGEKGNLIGLYRLAMTWNWQDEAQHILENIVNAFPEEHWAAQQLSQILYTEGSTRPLMQLFSTESTRNPDNLDMENNLALTAMLLRAQEMNPYSLARDVYTKDPTNSSYACTYAFSLYLQGKNPDALKIMQSISPQEINNNNSTAGYYGLILKAAGDNADANTYLRRSVRGQLLPEERAMFQQAMTGM